jgi:hypothetical protein
MGLRSQTDRHQAVVHGLERQRQDEQINDFMQSGVVAYCPTFRRTLAFAFKISVPHIDMVLVFGTAL